MIINKNIIGGIIFLALGIFLLTSIPSQIPLGSGMEHGPRVFPRFASMLMVISSASVLLNELIIQLIRRKNGVIGTKSPSTRNLSIRNFFRVLTVFGIVFLYMILMEYIGFVVSSFIMCILLLIFYRIKKWHYYLILIGITTVVYVIFTYLMKIELP